MSNRGSDDKEFQGKLALVKSGVLRMIGRQRARKLRKKGVTTWFDRDLQSRVWQPRHAEQPS